MTKLKLVLTASAAAILLSAAALPAMAQDAATPPAAAPDASAAPAAPDAGAPAPAKHHRHHGYVSQPAAHAQAAQPEIACTKGGCIPVPPGCHAAMGRSPNGTPTSFDVAVCGDYTLYGNR